MAAKTPPAADPRRRWFAIAGAVVLVVIIGWYIHWRSPEVQAPALFARITTAIKDADPQGCLAQIHPDYDFKTNWPQVFSENGAGELGGAYSPRIMAMAGLKHVLDQQQSNPIDCVFTIDDLQAQDDGTVVVLVSLAVRTRDGSPPAFTVEPPLRRHRFVLARSGFMSAALYIRGHAPIPVNGL